MHAFYSHAFCVAEVGLFGDSLKLCIFCALRRAAHFFIFIYGGEEKMANSRTFVLQNGVTVEKIGEYIVNWFQTRKNMIAEGGPAQGGYFIQAKDKEDGWKKFSGMTKALQIQLLRADNNVIVNCDFGKWSDKIGAGAVGMVLFAPLAATAAFGAVMQSKLPEEVFAEIEKFIINGGNSVVVGIGSRINDNEVECPNCKSKNPKGQKFCKDCGAKLGKECPHCGASIDGNTAFCTECGKPVNVAKTCVSCGAPLADNQTFCPTCGAKQEITCPKCGAAVEPGKKFCSSCGASLSDTKLCPNCKSEITNNAPFCSNCGTKIE